MTTDETNVLVFKDQAGEYYLLPRETLERGHVPAEHRAEVEHLVAESHDVSGHVAFLAGVFVGVIIGGGTAIATIAHEQSQQGNGGAAALGQQAADTANRLRNQFGR